MEKFRNWYLKYQSEITWFVIGLMFSNMLIHLSSGQYMWAVIDAAIAYVNYFFWKQNV